MYDKKENSTIIQLQYFANIEKMTNVQYVRILLLGPKHSLEESPLEFG